MEALHLANRLPPLDALLFEVLEDLSDAQWEGETIVPNWRIKDIAVHLLDGNLRTLSMLRDHYFGEKAENLDSYEDLVKYLNRLNADWVTAMRRLSPKVILELLRTSGQQYCQYLANLDPDEEAVFQVAWAGEAGSRNWFHIAREYTEKWHHQQQIRLALGAERVLLQEEWYRPYLEVSMRGLPHHYRNTPGQMGDAIRISFKGKTLKSWYLLFTGKWELQEYFDGTPNCTVDIPDPIAWRIFTKGMDRNLALEQSSISGKRGIGLPIFHLTAVMA
ncbi:MAG: maleylpyruvate isomerase N-terminal domain-containing protein [Saprospiraceae bacterium]|nr:maleylpyruvate isomerase N-terminal domain-containing protein [Saprospiraceae bacterium]